MPSDESYGYGERAYERGFRAGVEAATGPIAAMEARIQQLKHDREFFKRMFMTTYEQLTGEKAPWVSPKAEPKATAQAHPDHKDGGAIGHA